MKIDDTSNKLPPIAVPAGKPATTEAPPPAHAATSEKVSLSGTAKATSTRDAPIDAAKVEKIRIQIERGEFRIDADRIASDMITASRELLAQKH